MKTFSSALVIILVQVLSVVLSFTSTHRFQNYDAIISHPVSTAGHKPRHKQSNTLSQLQAFSPKKTNPAYSSGDGDKIERFSVRSSRGSDAVKMNVRDGKANVWDSFKSTIYGTVDGVGSLSEKLKAGNEGPGVQGGYSSIEKSVLSSSTGSPGQRLMSEYRSRSSSSLIQQDNSSAKRGSAFDAFKATVYGTVDVASQVFSSQPEKQLESLQTFKPLVQSTLSSSEIQKVLPDLQSPNPITRRIAEGKIKNWEEKERKRQRALEREEAARKFKESVYQLGDAVVWSAETLATVPSKVSYAAKETGSFAKKVQKSVEKIPGKVEEVVTTVSSIPDQVRAKSEELQNSVKTSVESTKKAVDEVKAIPSKIENTVKETKEKVNSAVTAVEEVATNVKVFVGLEKPKPKPPKVPPPPPPTAGEVGLKIAGSVATGLVTGSAKLAWWVGKGAAVAAWNGVQLAYQNAAGTAPAVVNTEQDSPQSNAGMKSSSVKLGEDGENRKASKGNAPPLMGDSDVDKEVQEALWLAQSAIDFADKESSARRDSDDGSDESARKK